MEAKDKELEVLLEEWEKHDQPKAFMRDGIMRNGHEREWYNSNCRIMFLLKEGNGDGGDVRDWLKNTGEDDNYTRNRNLGNIRRKRTIFYPLACILYGIKYLKENKRVCSFKDVLRINADYTHIKMPFAYVEAKKEPGKGKAINKEIIEYIQESKHKEFLKNEIQILDSTIIICCDNGKCKLEKTIRELLSEEKKQFITVLTTYHPSAPSKYHEAMYYRVMNSLNPFNKYEEEKNLLNTSFKTSIEMLASKHGLNCKYTPGNWCKQYEGQFSFYKPEWKHFCICFEFMGDNLTNFNYGVKYKDESILGKEEETKMKITQKLDGTASQWYASYKAFDPKDWNNDDVLDILRNGTMSTLIEDTIDSLLKKLKGIRL